MGRQEHRNVEADTPSAYWKRSLYLPFLDHLVNELDEQLVKPLPGFQVQLLIPGKLIALTERAIADIFSYYGSDMGISEDEFKTEVTRWKHKWSGMDPNVTPQTLVETRPRKLPILSRCCSRNIVNIPCVNMHCRTQLQ